MTTIADLAEGLDLDRNVIQHWANSGVLEADGKRYRRSFSHIEVNVACVLRSLSRYRIPVPVLKRIAGAVREAIMLPEEPRSGNVVTRDIRRVFEVAAEGGPAWLLFGFNDDGRPDGHEDISAGAVYDDAQFSKEIERVSGPDGSCIAVDMVDAYGRFRKTVSRESVE